MQPGELQVPLGLVRIGLQQPAQWALQVLARRAMQHLGEGMQRLLALALVAQDVGQQDCAARQVGPIQTPAR